MRTGLTKQEKTTDIWFDEKDPLIHIRTHNTALKKRLLAYSRRYPAICQQTDADPETGCMEFDIEKGRFSFRLTAPYSEERREAARRYARGYFSRDGEIRHNNQGLLRAPHPTFCSDRSVLDDSDFLSFGLAGLCLLKISFTA